MPSHLTLNLLSLVNDFGSIASVTLCMYVNHPPSYPCKSSDDTGASGGFRWDCAGKTARSLAAPLEYNCEYCITSPLMTVRTLPVTKSSLKQALL